MKCTSAVVLSTLAVGQAAALNHRHASFHARREAASKRDMKDVKWDDVAYDLKNVDWNAVNWSSVFASTPAAKPTPTPEQKKPAPVVAATPTPEPKKEAPPAPSKPAEKPVEAPKPAAPSKKPDSYETNDVVGDLMAGVASVGEAIGAKMGVNAKASNGGLWVGGDSANGVDVTNTGEDAVWYCWVKSGFTGMSLNVNAPAISVGMKKGQTVKISAAQGVSGGCAPATANTGKSIFGGVKNTWFEFTTPTSGKTASGAFNISKNVNMKGCSISAQGSTCTSDMNTCVFQCKDTSAESCEFGYDLINCSAGNGGGGGYDPIMQGVGGGCTMADNGERLKVSFST